MNNHHGHLSSHAISVTFLQGEVDDILFEPAKPAPPSVPAAPDWHSGHSVAQHMTAKLPGLVYGCVGKWGMAI